MLLGLGMPTLRVTNDVAALKSPAPWEGTPWPRPSHSTINWQTPTLPLEAIDVSDPRLLSKTPGAPTLPGYAMRRRCTIAPAAPLDLLVHHAL